MSGAGLAASQLYKIDVPDKFTKGTIFINRIRTDE